jgi:hypothetical protein
MADNKNMKIGETVYLKEGESFDNVRMPNGTVGSEQPSAAKSSTVRVSDQAPARQIRIGGSSIVRANPNPQPAQQRPQPAQQPVQQPQEDQSGARQFVRASKMKVEASDMPAEQPQPRAERPFTRASAAPVQVVEPPVAVESAEAESESAAKMAIDLLAKSKREEVREDVPAQSEEEYTGEDQGEEDTAVERAVNGEEGLALESAVELNPENIGPEDSKSDKLEAPASKPRRKAKVVDINKINVISKTEVDKERDLRQALFNNKSAFQIVAAQSGYVAKVAPLVHKDVVNILYGNLGRYEYKKAVYKTVHDKVFETSVGKMDFDSWLRNTTVEDMETFYYGVYSSTFPNEGTFRFMCPKCNKEHDYKVNHANLIKTTDREHMKRLIEEVTRNSTSVEKMKEYSLIGKNQAVQLQESNLVVELRTPSLLDSLEILRTVPEKTIDKDTISITNMLYIDRILIPSKEANGYTEESSKTAVLRIIDSLSIEDANELQSTVYDRVDENRITYSIKNIKCSECGREEKDIPISIEDILFTLIFEKAQ